LGEGEEPTRAGACEKSGAQIGFVGGGWKKAAEWGGKGAEGADKSTSAPIMTKDLRVRNDSPGGGGGGSISRGAQAVEEERGTEATTMVWEPPSKSRSLCEKWQSEKDEGE